MTMEIKATSSRASHVGARSIFFRHFLHHLHRQLTTFRLRNADRVDHPNFSPQLVQCHALAILPHDRQIVTKLANIRRTIGTVGVAGITLVRRKNHDPSDYGNGDQDPRRATQFLFIARRWLHFPIFHSHWRPKNSRFFSQRKSVLKKVVMTQTISHHQIAMR
jgi:hypothetical protein